LPLNIFEPRYLAMTRDALSGPRIIGMIQPDAMEDLRAPQVATYRTGCAGRIVQFAETPDGRYLITLAGLIRFDKGEELPLRNGYRRVVPDFAQYRGDMEGRPGRIERERLLARLKQFLERHDIGADWKAIEMAPDEQLVNALAMMCPFGPSEKQALLEAPDVGARCTTMIALLEMAVAASGEAGQIPQ
jgi:Lon protease-like protein